MKSSKQNILIIAGIAGPVIYFLVLFILGLLWQEYNPILQHMSELGGVGSPYKNIMNIFGFMLVGIFLMLFAFGFRSQFKKGVFREIIFLNLMISGFFMFLVGFFPCDRGCVNVTQIGKLHTITSIPQSISLPLAAIFSSFLFVQDTKWKRWARLSFTLGILSMLTGPLMSLSAVSPVIGLVQRVGMGLSLLWVFMLSVKMTNPRGYILKNNRIRK